MSIQKTSYQPPDPAVVDAIYSFENGGMNPAQDRSSAWRNSKRGMSMLDRYRIGRTLRSCYQGFWWSYAR
jgi:hypothetical protein